MNNFMIDGLLFPVLFPRRPVLQEMQLDSMLGPSPASCFDIQYHATIPQSIRQFSIEHNHQTVKYVPNIDMLETIFDICPRIKQLEVRNCLLEEQMEADGNERNTKNDKECLSIATMNLCTRFSNNNTTGLSIHMSYCTGKAQIKVKF